VARESPAADRRLPATSAVQPVSAGRPAAPSPCRGGRSAAIAPGVVLVFIAWHALMVLMVAGAGKDQSWDTTFDILGIWAAVDVMLAAGVGLWKLTARRNEPAPRG
jgi:hypothetical protein